MPLKPRIHVLDVDVGEKFKSKEAGEEKLAILKKNAEQIYANLEDIEMNELTEKERNEAHEEEHGDVSPGRSVLWLWHCRPYAP